MRAGLVDGHQARLPLRGRNYPCGIDSFQLQWLAALSRLAQGAGECFSPRTPSRLAFGRGQTDLSRSLNCFDLSRSLKCSRFELPFPSTLQTFSPPTVPQPCPSCSHRLSLPRSGGCCSSSGGGSGSGAPGLDWDRSLAIKTSYKISF